MKNNIIFKICILLILSATLLFSGSLSSREITNMVAEIKKERKGISVVKLESTENPFVVKIPKKKELTEIQEEVSVLAPLEITHTLKAILNNAAFIDKKWYKKGDTIGNYKVGYISLTSVILESDNGNKTLSLEKKKKFFIKMNKGYR